MNVLAALLNKKCIEQAAPSQATIADAFAAFGCICPPELVQVYGVFPGGFVSGEDGESVLFFSPDQIHDVVEKLLPISIAETGVIPLADLKDNNYLGCKPMKSSYGIYNLIDETWVCETRDLSAIVATIVLPE